MKLNRKTLKVRMNSISTTISSFLIPLIQYVPCTGVWFGIMSVPFITNLALYFQSDFNESLVK